MSLMHTYGNMNLCHTRLKPSNILIHCQTHYNFSVKIEYLRQKDVFENLNNNNRNMEK